MGRFYEFLSVFLQDAPGIHVIVAIATVSQRVLLPISYFVSFSGRFSFGKSASDWVFSGPSRAGKH